MNKMFQKTWQCMLFNNSPGIHQFWHKIIWQMGYYIFVKIQRITNLFSSVSKNIFNSKTNYFMSLEISIQMNILLYR